MSSYASRTTRGLERLYDSIVDTIGNTACIRLNRIAPGHVRMYVKAESFNPAASVKDLQRRVLENIPFECATDDPPRQGARAELRCHSNHKEPTS